jgi:hypothetical protein
VLTRKGYGVLMYVITMKSEKNQSRKEKKIILRMHFKVETILRAEEDVDVGGKRV